MPILTKYSDLQPFSSLNKNKKFTRLNLSHKKLIISRNNITIAPNYIIQLKKLKYLSLKANKIKVLPKKNGILSNLEFFNLSFNQL